MRVKPKITELLKWLREGVYEKDEIIALSMLSAIAGESIFLLGAPGVAKSLVARRLKYAFKDATAFEYLMNRFSTPDEIFGPVSISQLKDHDKYERIVKNYLPSATVVFLDEIWKASPSIQNALLTVLNEKIYRNGEQEIKVPMKALISASNELPVRDQGLDALWDRFLVRIVVEGIKDRKQFDQMISKSNNVESDKVSPDLKITNDEYLVWSSEIDNITIPENIFDIIHIVRGSIQLHNEKEENKNKQIYVSDRRWKKMIRLLRCSAYLNDRKSVDLMDCFLIAHCIWNEVEQKDLVFQFVKDAIQKHGYKLEIDSRELKEQINDFRKEVKEETSFLKPVLKERLKIYNKDYYKIPDFNDYYIKIKDFEALKTTDSSSVEFFSEQQGKFHQLTTKSCKKGKKDKKDIVLIKNSYYETFSEYPIEIEKYQAHITLTKKPHQATKKHWDKEVSKYLTITGNLKSQIDNYRKTDLDDLGRNLFVSHELVKIVITNLDDSQNEIEKIEVNVREIQHEYENIEDQTQKDPKLLSNSTTQQWVIE